jgi:2-polyprenyl-3-methyl-5-hydroxy-6-metoxy-1,4-benzoquinol methylase
MAMKLKVLSCPALLLLVAAILILWLAIQLLFLSAVRKSSAFPISFPTTESITYRQASLAPIPATSSKSGTTNHAAHQILTGQTNSLAPHPHALPADIGAKVHSTNELHYDQKYFAWQSSMNVFGGLFKGDFLNHLLTSFRRFVPVSSILEFGSSGGNIVNALVADRRVGVEINDIARISHTKTFPLVESYKRLEEVPGKIDFVYSWSVLEHVDSPLASLQQLLETVSKNGVLLLIVRNDGLNKDEFSWPGPPHSRENNHIWTWNAALLGNLMAMAGWRVCDVRSEFTAWHGKMVQEYKADKHKYCKTGLDRGKAQNVQSVFGLAIAKSGDDASAKTRCAQLVPLFKGVFDCAWVKV